jgi:glycosyltransferase involved in cell wall biosynthesis
MPATPQLPPIIYFGNDWFADNRTSSHHVARQLACHTEVLYVESPGMRPPSASARDVRRLFVKLSRALGGAVTVAPSLSVRTLLQLPVHGSAPARALNSFVSGLYARMALRFSGMRKPIVWCTIPHVANFVHRIDRSLLVYHCIDDYAVLPGVDAVAIRAFDEQLSRGADLVAAASGPVYEVKRRQNPRAILMPHGVDVDHFATARTSGAMPADLQGLGRPIVGFTGLIERWIDLDLVGWLAQQLPQVTFVMIGRVAVPAESVPSAPNLHFLGPRPYESLPAYGRGFDAAIIPYRLTDQVHAANPLKLREYLAMGLPTVAVSTPEIDKFAGVVSVTRTREEFLAALVATLAAGSDPALIRRRMDAVKDVSWATRVDELLVSVQSLLVERSRPDPRHMQMRRS